METIEKIFELLEYRKVHLSGKFSTKRVAQMANMKPREIDKLLYHHFGLSLKQLISLYRKQSIAG